MSTRIVVADQSEALFYEAERFDVPLQLIERLTDPHARLHDRDLKSDRPGRVFDHAPQAGRRRGTVARHGTEGERRPRKQEALRFARRIGRRLEADWRKEPFGRLVLVAAPGFLGVLRAALPGSVKATARVEVPKRLVREPERVIRTHVAPHRFRRAPE